MLIRSSVAPATARKPTSRPAAASKPSFQETALKSTIIGASLGTVVGETVGQGAFLGGAGYLGWRLGQSFAGGPVTGLLGAAVSTGAAYLVERKFPVGATLGSVGGFLTGGLIGGFAGSVIGGVQAIAHSDFFKKG